MKRTPALLFCAVASLMLSTTRSTAQDGDVFRVNVTIHDPTKAYSGLNTEITDTETTSMGKNPWFRIFWMKGGVSRTWKDPLPNWGFAELVKPLSFGRLLALIFDRSTAGQGPRDKQLVELDWNGNVIWRFDARPQGLQLHHDFDRLDNGNTLVIAQRPRLAPPINANLILDDLIIEVNSAGTTVWEWSAANHIGEMGFTASELNYLANFPGQAPFAVFHMNSIQTLPENQWEASDPRFRAGNILVSLRETNLVLIIDKTTKLIVWRYQGAIGQHHPRMIPKNLPGAGNILLFDNGGQSGAPPVFRPYSRVLEINPVTKAIVWDYQCNEASAVAGSCSRFFYTKVMGGAQRLANGNTLVTQAVGGRVFEVTPSKQIVWEYYAKNKLYRTYRWDGAWAQRGPIPKFAW